MQPPTSTEESAAAKSKNALDPPKSEERPVEARKPGGASPDEVNAKDDSIGDTAENGQNHAAGSANDHEAQESSSKPAQNANGSAASLSEAVNQAKDLMAKSRRNADKGKPSQAYQDVQRAWELMQPFPNDTECRQLAAEADVQMKSLAKAANAKYSGEKATRKALIEQ